MHFTFSTFQTQIPETVLCTQIVCADGLLGTLASSRRGAHGAIHYQTLRPCQSSSVRLSCVMSALLQWLPFHFLHFVDVLRHPLARFDLGVIIMLFRSPELHPVGIPSISLFELLCRFVAMTRRLRSAAIGAWPPSFVQIPSCLAAPSVSGVTKCTP